MDPRHLAIALAAVVPATTNTANQVGAFQSEKLAIERGGVRLAADLLVPPGDDLPAVAIVHGSGDSDRSNAWTAAWADALAKRGIAVLHPDKRGCGESGGDWKQAAFDVLAADAIAQVEALAEDPRFDSSNIGVIGFSQGGAIAPIAGGSDAVGFAISVSGSVVPLVEQVRDEVGLAIERAAVDPKLAASVLALQDKAADHVAGRCPFADYATALAELKRGPLGGSPLVTAFPATEDSSVWTWAKAVGNPDPMSAWQKCAGPALFVYGTADTQIRVAKSVARLQQDLDPKATPWDLLLLGGNGHGVFREDAADFVARWIRDHGER